MITIDEFNYLNEDQKGEEVYKGVFLAERKEGRITVQLFSSHNFYAEVYYEPLENKILRFRSFDSIRFLEPFLKDLKF